MATKEQIACVHENIGWFSSVGSLSALLGMATYFMGYEASNGTRRRDTVTQMVRNISALLYLAGLVVLTLGMILYVEEREEEASDIPSLLQQTRNKAAQPDIHEPAILAGVSSAIVLLGAFEGLREFHKTERFGWMGSAMYAAGWLGNGFAASMNNKSINSISTTRIAWTLPGAAAIVMGTFIFPWQYRQQYVSGPAWPLVSLGYILFTIGNSLVLGAPTLVTS